MVTQTVERVSRRTLLKAVGGTVAVSAFGSVVSPIGAEADTSGVIEDVSSSDGTIYVELEDVGVADQVTLVDPNGQEVDRDELELGQSSGAFVLLSNSPGSDYDEGTYTAFAYRSEDGDDEEVGTAEFDLEANVEAIGLRSERMLDPVVMLENTGTGPATVDLLRITEGMPGYTDVPGDGGSSHDIILGSGERVAVQHDVSGTVSKLQIQDEETADEWSGTTETAVFEVDTTPGGTTESSFDISFDSTVEAYSSGLIGSDYGFPETTGGEGISYE